MFRHFRKIFLPFLCLMLSILAHVLFMTVLGVFESYDFNAPVNQFPDVVFDLAELGGSASVSAKKSSQKKSDKTSIVEEVAAPDSSVQVSKQRQTKPEQSDTPDVSAEENALSGLGDKTTHAVSPDDPHLEVTATTSPRLLKSRDFLSSTYEKLTYQISLLGVTVGSAELEAKSENGETLITLRVRSHTIYSSIYPVDNLVETRHISDRFIMAKIIQQEGGFRSDQLLTINPAKKRVTWADLINGRSLKTTVPSEDVLDTLSGIYYLRNRPLQVGKTETLHIYDSETYADVPVEILRSEEIRMPNLTKLSTLVVRPLQKTAGIFRRTGDILIWMTNDDYKVPVKIVTTIALGTVTAELVSAESKL